MIPFAVVGSQTNVSIDGKLVRGRKNRYGIVNVEDERHCEFVYLRNFLTRSVSSPPPLFSFFLSSFLIDRKELNLIFLIYKKDPFARFDRVHRSHAL